MNQVVDKTGSMGQALAREITSGVYRQGEKLPGERKLCDYFNVSRTTARTVLKYFEDSGIIIRKPRSGAYIAENAVELIEQDMDKSLLRTFFIMPPRQQTNPLIRTVFSTFQEYVNPSIQTSVLFVNEISDSLPYLNENDVAVVFSVDSREELEMLKRQVSKLIILNRRNPDYDYISPDNYTGGMMMAEYLLECGHRKIGCPLFKQTNPDSDFNRRCLGLQETLKQVGIDLELFFIPAEREFDGSAFSEALELFADQGVTTISCLSDKMAMNIYAQATSHGMRIPDDFSVIGFDDQYYAQYTCPPLTTVKYPAEALGIRLAGVFNDHLTEKEQCINEVIKPILIKRQSVRNLTKEQ